MTVRLSVLGWLALALMVFWYASADSTAFNACAARYSAATCHHLLQE